MAEKTNSNDMKPLLKELLEAQLNALEDQSPEALKTLKTKMREFGQLIMDRVGGADIDGAFTRSMGQAFDRAEELFKKMDNPDEVLSIDDDVELRQIMDHIRDEIKRLVQTPEGQKVVAEIKAILEPTLSSPEFAALETQLSHQADDLLEKMYEVMESEMEPINNILIDMLRLLVKNLGQDKIEGPEVKDQADLENLEDSLDKMEADDEESEDKKNEKDEEDDWHSAKSNLDKEESMDQDPKKQNN